MALHGHTCGNRAAVPRRLCWSDKFTLEGERMTRQGGGIPRLMERRMRIKQVPSIHTYIIFLSRFIVYILILMYFLGDNLSPSAAGAEGR